MSADELACLFLAGMLFGAIVVDKVGTVAFILIWFCGVLTAVWLLMKPVMGI